MKSPRFEILAGVVVALLGTLPSACGGEGPGAPEDEAAPAHSAQVEVHAKIGAASPGAAVRVEQAERKLDVGGDAAAARAAIEEALRDGALSPERRDQAKLALSRALEAQGDKEGAVTTIEGLLAEHADDHRWPLSERAERRLRKLLTGSEGNDEAGDDEERPAAPAARALAKYFPETKEGVDINILAFGGSREASERAGTFEIARAVRELKREACPLCDDSLRARTGFSRGGSWVEIPANRQKLASSLAVFYFDLGDDRIPARYDADLPIPSAEIVAHLEKGEGLVVARERRGAPPSIVIAAPRAAELAEVENALAMMKSLPGEPTVVALSAKLRPSEIQSVVRGSRKAQKACYEKLLARTPGAAGNVALKFTIDGSGKVEGATAETESVSLRDAEFEQCLSAATGSLVFAATGEKTTVSYPLTVAP